MAYASPRLCISSHIPSGRANRSISRLGTCPLAERIGADMFKMSIKPQWLVEAPDAVRRPLHQLIEVLTATDEAGQLSAGAKKLGVSYRYAWELVRGGSRIFGAPLVAMTRGRGAELTALGEKLLWANRRIAARLDPTLDSLASELEVETESRVARCRSSGVAETRR